MSAKSKSPAPAAVKSRPQSVLIAVTGLSPAVLTETIWELARDKNDPIIPDKVIVLTTLSGEKKIKDQLFGSDELWLTLREQLLGKGHETDPRLDFAETSDRIRVFTRKTGGKRIPLDRMDTKEETEAVGDCLVEELWNWVGRPDTRVLASISGGFKTMSALLYAAMTVLGGQRDRILHVLVNEPYDGNTNPLFYWPKQPCQQLHTSRASKLDPPGIGILASKAKLVLTDVEFPPLRHLFDNYGFKEAPTFGSLVAMSRNSVINLSIPPVEMLILHPDSFSAELNEIPLSNLSKTEFAMLLFLAESVCDNCSFEGAGRWAEAYREFLISRKMTAPKSMKAFYQERLEAATVISKTDGNSADEGRFTKTLSALRRKLDKGPIAGKALARHLPKGKPGFTLEASRITIVERPPNLMSEEIR